LDHCPVPSVEGLADPLVAVMPHPAGAHVPAEQLTQEVPDGYD
jgi:hypothetical protein